MSATQLGIEIGLYGYRGPKKIQDAERRGGTVRYVEGREIGRWGKWRSVPPPEPINWTPPAGKWRGDGLDTYRLARAVEKRDRKAARFQ